LYADRTDWEQDAKKYLTVKITEWEMDGRYDEMEEDND
jgi:hypothetical protein